MVSEILHLFSHLLPLTHLPLEALVVTNNVKRQIISIQIDYEVRRHVSTRNMANRNACVGIEENTKFAV